MTLLSLRGFTLTRLRVHLWVSSQGMTRSVTGSRPSPHNSVCFPSFRHVTCSLTTPHTQQLPKPYPWPPSVHQHTDSPAARKHAPKNSKNRDITHKNRWISKKVFASSHKNSFIEKLNIFEPNSVNETRSLWLWGVCLHHKVWWCPRLVCGAQRDGWVWNLGFGKVTSACWEECQIGQTENKLQTHCASFSPPCCVRHSTLIGQSSFNNSNLLQQPDYKLYQINPQRVVSPLFLLTLW